MSGLIPSLIRDLVLDVTANSNCTVDANGKISKIVDLVNGYEFVQTNSSRQPTLVTDGLGKKGISFLGNNQSILTPTYTLTPPSTSEITVFAVAYFNASNVNSQLFSSYRPATLLSGDIHFYQNLIGLNGSSNNMSYALPLSRYNIITLTISSSTGACIGNIRVNGDTTSHDFNNNAVEINPIIELGNWTSYGNVDSRNFKGVFHELVQFNRKLLDYEIEAMEAYLANSWGLINDLPEDNPFKANPSTITYANVQSFFTSKNASYSVPVYSFPVSNICFPAGTLINVDQGRIPIETINAGLHTIRNKKIVDVTKTVSQDNYLVCFEKDALANNIPSEKTVISKNHKLFYKGAMIQAKEFLGKCENVHRVKYTGEVLYNVLMEEDDKMIVNNLICETLNPENGIAKLYTMMKNMSPEDQETSIKLYNAYCIKNNVFSSKKMKR